MNYEISEIKYAQVTVLLLSVANHRYH